MKNHKIIIISIISVISIGIIAGIWILFSPDAVKDTDRLTSVSDTDPVIVDIENQEQADSRKEGKDQSELKELVEGRANTVMDPDDGSDGAEEKLQDASGAGQKIEQNNKKTAEYKQEASAEAVRESNSNSAIVNTTTIPVDTTENKAERTTAAADSAPVITTENKTVSTTEAATERKTEVTTEATTRSTTQSTTESATEAATTEAVHTHTWKAVYKTVKHEEVGHWEEVEAGQLEHPIEEGHSICSNPGCGYDYTAHGQHGTDYHQCADGTVGSNYHNEQVIVGYWFETFYDDVWVVDQKAYTEQVVDYYECSECGARK